MFRRNCFHYYLRVCTELHVLSITASRLIYKNGNLLQRTDLQRHTRPSITHNESDNFSSETSGNLPKIATSKVILSRTADRIAVKFCMTIQKIKANDIVHNCVHSTSTLRVFCYRTESDLFKLGTLHNLKYYCCSRFIGTTLVLNRSGKQVTLLHSLTIHQPKKNTY